MLHKVDEYILQELSMNLNDAIIETEWSQKQQALCQLAVSNPSRYGSTIYIPPARKTLIKRGHQAKVRQRTA